MTSKNALWQSFLTLKTEVGMPILITIKADIWISILSNSLLGPQSHFLVVGLQYKFSSEKQLNSSTQPRKITWIQQDTIKSDELSAWAYANSKRKKKTQQAAILML